MTVVADILSYIEEIAPTCIAEDWDNVGLLCGRKNQPVKKILVALDPFETVCNEAFSIGADLIVTHHPMIFGNALNTVNDQTQTGRCLLMLAENKISAINAHTNLDKAPGGVNDVLAAALGLENIKLVSPEGVCDNGMPYGLLRSGIVKEQSLSQFLSYIKNALGCDGLRYIDSGKPVCNVAVGGGSCADSMYEVVAAGCDTFVTADVKYNQFRNAYELGINLIDAGHFHTENPTMPVLAEKLQSAFPDVEVVFSENHRDIMKYFV